MKRTGRTLALLLALVMVFSLMSTAAFAAGPEKREDPFKAFKDAFRKIDLDQMKDVGEDGKFEFGQFIDKIKFDTTEGKDNPIGKLKFEFAQWNERLDHEMEQLTERMAILGNIFK